MLGVREKSLKLPLTMKDRVAITGWEDLLEDQIESEEERAGSVLDMSHLKCLLSIANKAFLEDINAAIGYTSSKDF